MGAVHLAPLLRQLQDLLDLLVQQAVDRATTGGSILQYGASHSPGLPAAHPGLRWPAALGRPRCMVNPSATAWSTSPSSACLVAGPSTWGDAADQPRRRCSPQQHQLDRLLLDRLAQPLYLRPGRGQLGVLAGLAPPGLEAASASSAPCLAT